MTKVWLFSWLMLLSLVFPLVYGLDDTSDYLACWKLDNNQLHDVTGKYNYTDADTLNITGKMLDGRDFTSAHNDRLLTTGANSLNVNYTKSKTIEFWMYIDSCTSDCALVEDWSGTAADRELGIFLGSAGAYSNKIRTVTHNPGGGRHPM